MTLFAPDETETLLSRLDARTQAAWSAYAAAIDGREGRDYDRAESGAWALLQVELRGIDTERRDLISISA